MRQSILLAALSAATVVVAQNQNFTINPGTVNPSTRVQWCNSQFNTCGILCQGTAKANDCQSDALTYTCTCSNGTAPGLDYYSQTLPSLICMEAFSQCITANVGDSQGQSKCKTDIEAKCGKLDPAKADFGSDASESSTSSAATSASTAGAAASSAPTSSSSQAAAPTNMAYSLGNGVAAMAAGVFAAALL
ncbi:hypothetical protein QBC35DRAFT_447194 [Podospora australis]|uniref:DUF7707 domain-containing protein n=1 Tax=Podospora australis TaxID=1536484 RepID=A0AAN6X645_9PEZI|nr:hypothetical protein QBC35DRAFT_447194 [Podospora australis]